MNIIANELWNKLPHFMRGAKTMRADILESSDDVVDEGPYGASRPWKASPIEQANLITSEFDDFFGSIHRPVLDIDYGAELVPSSTPGHFHLYLDTLVSLDAYLDFLKAAAAAGIIQQGFYESAVKRGATSARLPWIKKGDKKANSLDPDKEKREAQERIALLEAEIATLKANLSAAEAFEAMELDSRIPW